MSLPDNFVVGLPSSAWIGSLLARVAVGCAFLLSGGGKLLVKQRREQMRETLRAVRVPFLEFNVFFVPAVEFGCGLLLILGAATTLGCVLLGILMIVAIATVVARNIKASSALGWLSEFLYLPEVLYLVILVWLFLSGPGSFSVDDLLGK